MKRLQHLMKSELNCRHRQSSGERTNAGEKITSCKKCFTFSFQQVRLIAEEKSDPSNRALKTNHGAREKNAST